jgi:Tol biopolymer transport system component
MYILATLLLAAGPVVGPPERWTPAAIAGDQYESSPSFTPDGREMYFMRSDRSFGGYRILMSRCENGAWTKPEAPPFAAKPPALDADPFVSGDGRRIYFVSSRQNKDGGDQLDIWMVRRGADGVFGDPERLPEPINSPASELLPRYTAQGRLYFGSDRPGGHGQGDIYVATEREGGGWDLENMGPPLSTPANEYEADVSRDGQTMIVVADRGKRSHLYRYRREGSAFIDEKWIEVGQIPADDGVFQVGPLLSPKGDRLLFAQREGEERSGEIFLLDLTPDADKSWPPRCGS